MGNPEKFVRTRRTVEAVRTAGRTVNIRIRDAVSGSAFAVPLPMLYDAAHHLITSQGLSLGEDALIGVAAGLGGQLSVPKSLETELVKSRSARIRRFRAYARTTLGESALAWLGTGSVNKSIESGLAAVSGIVYARLADRAERNNAKKFNENPSI